MRKQRGKRGPSLVMVLVLVALAGTVLAGNKYFETKSKPMMDAQNGWKADALFTVGETLFGYQPVGILDGTGA